MEDKRGFVGGSEDQRKSKEGNPPGAESKDKPEEGGRECTFDDNLSAMLDFSTFIISLTTSMLVNLGELPDPVTNQKCVNFGLARQTVRIIEILKEKTRGNLTEEEERLIESVLYDLRMKYVDCAKCSS
jgi:hypothetical protein